MLANVVGLFEPERLDVPLPAGVAHEDHELELEPLAALERPDAYRVWGVARILGQCGEGQRGDRRPFERGLTTPPGTVLAAEDGEVFGTHAAGERLADDLGEDPVAGGVIVDEVKLGALAHPSRQSLLPSYGRVSLKVADRDVAD